MVTATWMSTYPKEAFLPKYSTRVVLRPMNRYDAHDLLTFFLSIPGEDRFYLKEDVTSPIVVTRWAHTLDYDRVLPLLAVVEGEVIADATLHRRRQGARAHVGEIRILVDPRYRYQGLGTLLIKELLDIARMSGLERLVFELAEENQAEAIEMAKSLGFITRATLYRHVRDLHGGYHNLLVMEKDLTTGS